MSRVVIDDRGVVEESKGDGVIVNMRHVSTLTFKDVVVFRAKPTAKLLQSGKVNLWYEDGELCGVDKEGLKLFVKSEEEVKATVAVAPEPSLQSPSVESPKMALDETKVSTKLADKEPKQPKPESSKPLSKVSATTTKSTKTKSESKTAKDSTSKNAVKKLT